MIALTAVAGAIAGYLVATNFRPVFALPAPAPCAPVPCTPVACTGIGGVTANPVVGDSMQPISNPIMVGVF